MDDKIYAKLSEIEKTLVRNTVSLEEHMRRSDSIEKAVDILAEELKPIKSDMDRVKFLGTMIMWGLGSSGAILMIIKHLI